MVREQNLKKKLPFVAPKPKKCAKSYWSLGLFDFNNDSPKISDYQTRVITDHDFCLNLLTGSFTFLQMFSTRWPIEEAFPPYYR